MTALSKLVNWAHTHRWIWSGLAVLLFWVVLSTVTNRFSLASLSGIFLSASFLTVAGIGQMFVVTTGRGNIDLSIPSVLTLNAYIALLTVRGQDANLALGVLVALGVGLAVGLFNAALVVRLKVPAIIATLATGYVLATATLLANRSIHGFAVSPAVKFLAAGRIFGAPIMLLICIALIIATEFVLRKTVYGRALSGVGQNRAAARFAGVAVDRVITIAFVISAMLASILGLVLGAYVGGAFLEMGQPYLLQSIAAVVVGGTLIFGGSATAIGVFFASVLLILLVTLMQIMQLPPGSQDMLQGLVVILVLALAGRGAIRTTIIRSANAAHESPLEEARGVKS
jgi:ribose transport system permease protein